MKESLLTKYVSLNYIIEFGIVNWMWIVGVYLLLAWIKGVGVTRRNAATKESIGPDEIEMILCIIVLAPVWIPVYFLWNWLDLGGRKLRK